MAKLIKAELDLLNN